MNNILFIRIRITDKCNFTCNYCNSYIPYKNILIDDMDYRKLIIVTQHIKKYIPQDWYIFYEVTGGETLLHKNLKNILLILSKDIHKKAIVVLTNGSIDVSNLCDSQLKHIYWYITYHYDLFNNNKDKIKYYNMIVKNANKLISNGNKVKIKFLSTDTVLDNNMMYNKIKNDIDVNNLYIYIICKRTRSTNQYTSSKIRKINEYYNTYHYCGRSLAILNQFDFSFACDIANKIFILPHKYEYDNALHSQAWKNVKQYFFKLTKCTLTNCDCTTCEFIQQNMFIDGILNFDKI